VDSYRIALVVHIVGAFGLFAAFAFEWLATSRLGRTTTRDEVLVWLGVRSLVQRIGPLSMGLLLVPGLLMTASRWSLVSWPGAATLSVALGLGLSLMLTAMQRSPKPVPGLDHR
jgi:hypothetical protein